MASNPASGFTCQANGDKTPGRGSGSGRSRRLQSESESDAGPTVKSLARLCSRDEEERAAALEELSQGVLGCLELDRPGSARLSKQTLLHLLRLSRSCPLQEVRGRATELLRTAQVRYYAQCLQTRGELIQQQWGNNFQQVHLNAIVLLFALLLSLLIMTLSEWLINSRAAVQPQLSADYHFLSDYWIFHQTLNCMRWCKTELWCAQTAQTSRPDPPPPGALKNTRHTPRVLSQPCCFWK